MTLPAAADTPVLRKARGAFFTPAPICTYIAQWAIRTGSEKVLEPSCGEAGFLLAAGRRISDLGAVQLDQLHGAELHESSAAIARTLLRSEGFTADITTGDFFATDACQRFDAVIGNPPFVRYQDFSGEARAAATQAALRAGVRFSGLASSWAPFTVHAASNLKVGGRMGLVLPAELLTVNYASSVRSFLMEKFKSVRLVLFTERVFPEVLEEVVLVLAEGFSLGPTDHCELYQCNSADDLASLAGSGHSWRPENTGDKWTPSLLAGEHEEIFLRASQGAHFGPLEDWGDTTLGMVTGANKFFALSPGKIAALGLQRGDLIPLSPPGSRHLRGLSFSDYAWKELGKAGSATYLFRPKTDPSPSGWAYIAAGEKTGVQEAYKCAVRKPWWRVPLQKPADLLLTYMNADTPRLCENRKRAHHLNSVHGVYLKSDVRDIGTSLLPLASLNSVTLLAAETVGRSYGGGMLKLEPREADILSVPSHVLVRTASRDLEKVRPTVEKALRGNRLVDAARMVDEALLLRHAGMKRSELASIRSAHAELWARRVSRGRGA